MRTTGKINNSNALMQIGRNFQQLSKVTSQVAMQQQVIELDDNPLSASIGIKMLGMIAKADKLNSNVKIGLGILGLSDGYLGQAKTAVESLNKIVTGAANATSGETALNANKLEVNGILQSLIRFGNASDGSRYLFGGTGTTTPPFTVVNSRYVHYTGNNQNINLLVDNGSTMPVNVTGNAMYGNMTTSISSRDMNPRVNLSTDRSTPLSDLNAGKGIPKGKIVISYSGYPDGLEVDLSGCDTLEDVKDAIEQTTLDASRRLDPARNAWLNGENLDWRDLQDRYVKVTVNPDGNGISLQERDLGEPLPEPTPAERRRGLSYSGDAAHAADPADPAHRGYHAGGAGIAFQDDAPEADGGYTVHDKFDYVAYPAGGMRTSPLRVDDYALNKVAEGLGIKGMATMYDPARPHTDAGFLHGRDLDPAVSANTLLADLEGYNDGAYTLTNGGKPGSILIKETSQDGGVFDTWKLSGVSKGDNTGPDGELYARATNIGTSENPEIRIEISTKPFHPREPLASDIVATGVYTAKDYGGTVLLEEANNSGLSGSVGVLLPPNVGSGEVDLRIEFQDSLQASVHVPAFEEEQFADGTSKDMLNIASGWSIRGLDRPPAVGYDENHPASTDLQGNVSVSYRYDEDARSMIVELSRPASGNTPGAVIATGSIYLGDDYLAPDGDPATPDGILRTVSGRVELVGVPGFEQISGSVYIELPQGLAFTGGGSAGDGEANATTHDTRLSEAAPGGTVTLGGATAFPEDVRLTPGSTMLLKEDTLFKKGQVFQNDVILPGGGRLLAGTPLPGDTVVPKGASVQAETILAGTVLHAGQTLDVAGIPAGTIIPSGSYYSAPAGASFPASGSGMYIERFNPRTNTVDRTPADPASVAGGYNLRATFATVEDLQRAVEQAGVYVRANVSDDGRKLEFTSSLAGAWLTVSEDTDCYEQMGDANQQLTGLNLNGVVKGANTDREGNVYTEVVYYPPDPLRPDDPVRLTSKDGKVVEIEPGYYVRVYSDPAQMQLPYEDRDNTLLVAEGYVPSGKWNPDFDSQAAIAAATAEPPVPYDIPPFITTQEADGVGLFANGVMQNLILEERNNSGVWGTVDLDYHGDDGAQYEVVEKTTIVDGEPITSVSINGATRDNANITVYPGGLRSEGSHSVTMQEWNLTPVQPGVNCDYNGTFHGRITAESDTAVSIRLYKDSSNKILTAKNDPAAAIGPDGKVTLYAVDRHGEFALTADGERIPVGSVTLPAGTDRLEAGETEAFELKTGGIRHGGQHREDNIFSTINDIIDAMDQDDKDALHDLLGRLDADEERLTLARGEAGARSTRLTMLSERHADDVNIFTATLTSRVGMDDHALSRAVMDYQASTNAYQAAMQVSSQIMQMSLLQYL